MSRINASHHRFTLIGAVPAVQTQEAVDPIVPARTELARVPGDRGWRRQIVITEQTELSDVDPKCILLQEPTSPQARSYRLLRHRLLGSSDPRVIVVTSAGPTEGKTTCAINLALAIAEDALVRVLLVEANPVRPSFAEAFALKLPSSLNAWNVDGVNGTWPIAVANVAGTRLDVAASRPGSQGLDRLFFAVAMKDLRDAYDYVVIDTPSVLESADANIATECADGVIVTALTAQSRRAPLKRSIDQLRPATIFGVVLLDA